MAPVASAAVFGQEAGGVHDPGPLLGEISRADGGVGPQFDAPTAEEAAVPTTINDKLISWASDIDPGTIRQAEATARLPIVEGHVALMPDAHVGIGATVGSVIPTRGSVIPAAVGDLDGSHQATTRSCR